MPACNSRMFVPAAAMLVTIAGLTSGSCAVQPNATEQTATKPGVAEPAFDYSMLIRSGMKQAKPRTEGAVRLAAYNVENLFDDKDDPALSGRQEDIEMRKPDTELVELARAFRTIDADIVALQEVESREALEWFVENHLADMGYKHIVSIDAGDARGIENSIISRFPVVEPQVWPEYPAGGVHPEKYGTQENWYAGEPINIRRSPLKATVQIPADFAGGAGEGAEPYELTLFVVHHKSGRYSQYWREAEAKVFLKFAADVMAEDPRANVAILGDFNAMPGDKSVTMYSDAGFTDIFSQVEGTKLELATHASDRRIDFIMASPTFMPEVVVESGFVLGTPQLPKEIDYRTVETFPGYASDHYPVVVDFMPIDARAD